MRPFCGDLIPVYEWQDVSVGNVENLVPAHPPYRTLRDDFSEAVERAAVTAFDKADSPGPSAFRFRAILGQEAKDTASFLARHCDDATDNLYSYFVSAPNGVSAFGPKQTWLVHRTCPVRGKADMRRHGETVTPSHRHAVPTEPKLACTANVRFWG